MNKFKVGDKITVSPYHNLEGYSLNHGIEYEVDYVGKTAWDDEKEVIGIKDTQWSGRGCFYAYQFHLAEQIKTYRRAYEIARKKGIPGRSKLNKEQLIAAIKGFKLPQLPLGVELKNRVNGKNYNSNFAYEYPNGSRVFKKGAYCFADLNYVQPGVSALVVDISGWHNGSTDKEYYIKYVDYMLNRSPWKNMFLTKDVKEALESGVYMDVEQSLSRVACAAIALRQASEFPHKLEGFRKFIEDGYDENVSYLMASGVQYNKEKKGWMQSGLGGGHDVLYAEMEKDDVFKFFKHGFHRPTNAPFNKGGQRYKIFDSIAKEFGKVKLSSVFSSIGSREGFDLRCDEYEKVKKVAEKVKEAIEAA